MTVAGYAVDLERFKLSKLENMLKTVRLLPSQQLLKENLDENFECLKTHGIENLAHLQNTLKTKAKVEVFAELSGMDVKYLTLLRREVNSWQPKPIPLKDFPNVNLEIIKKLAEIGIKNTLHLYPHVLNPKMRAQFIDDLGIEMDDLLDLTRLADVARLKYVGPKFARLVVETEFNTVQKIQHADPQELFDALIVVNEEKDIYRGLFGLKDLKQWHQWHIQDLPIAIEY